MTASAEILGELAKSGLPLNAQAFLAACAEGEWGISFRTLYSGGKLLAAEPNIEVVDKLRQWTGDLSAFPGWHGATAAGGTISTASGAWQDTHTTWNDYAGSFGIADFEPQSQVQFNWKLANLRYPALASTLDAATADVCFLKLIHGKLGRTWPGGCDASFPKRYTKNLAVLHTPPPPPIPPDATYATSGSIEVRNGKPVSMTLTFSSYVALIASAAALTCCSSPLHEVPNDGLALTGALITGPHNGRAEGEDEARPSPTTAYGFSFDGASFRLVPGPLGPLAAPLAK